MHLDDVLTELVEHSGDRLLRVAYQLTHDAAAAQDLVQEALLRVYQSVRHLRTQSTHSTLTSGYQALIAAPKDRRPRSPFSSVVIRPSVMATCRTPARAVSYRSSSSY